MAPSSWGWCGYFTDGHDQLAGGDCTTGSDRQSHNNMALLPVMLCLIDFCK